MRPSELSNTSSTHARLTGLRCRGAVEDHVLHVTRRAAAGRRTRPAPSAPRRSRWTCRSRSGPTTPTSWPGTAMEVGSTKDLKPASLTDSESQGEVSVSACFESRTADAPSVEWRFYRNETPFPMAQPSKALETFPNPSPQRDYRDPHADPRVHLPVPEDRPARLRHARPRLRARPALRRVEEPEALHLVVPQRRALPRGRDQRDPRRAGAHRRSRASCA